MHSLLLETDCKLEDNRNMQPIFFNQIHKNIKQYIMPEHDME